jgi:MerR family transcriptional regulator, heat shock protein HspR
MSNDSGNSGKTPRKRKDGGELDETRGVFMISVAAELAGMHPQTLRMYEARGLITPKRSPKQTRLYSQADVERLRRIQEMTTEAGLNLAGVETVLDMEEQFERMRAEMAQMRKRAEEMQREMLEQLEQARGSLRAEIVPYGAYNSELGARPVEASEPVKIPIKRRTKSPKRKRG